MDYGLDQWKRGSVMYHIAHHVYKGGFQQLQSVMRTVIDLDNARHMIVLPRA